MSSSFHLIHLRPNLRHLLPWAQRQGLVTDRGQGDLGYAFHAALKAAFGDLTPQPFSYRAHQGLLAYSAHGEALQAACALATPEVANMLGLDASPETPGLLIREFPQSWTPGQWLAFELRVRPTVRKDDKELDAFLSAVKRLADAVPTRETVYGDWLKRRFGASANLHQVRMTEFRLSSVLRRGAIQAESPRPKHHVHGPDATFTGVLQVRDDKAFAALVARGLGRHRAFGFGMLLLKPAAAAGA